MRYAVSGVIGSGADGLSSTEDSTTLSWNLLGKQITTSRVLWLRSIYAYNCSTAATLLLLDASEGFAATASTKRISIPCASDRLTVVEFPSPGLKFSTDCVVVREATGAATGSFAQGEVGGAGYEE